MIGKLKKDSAPYTHHCSGEGREKREGKSLCGGNHITSLLYLREERKEGLTHSCKGILHLHTYDVKQCLNGKMDLKFSEIVWRKASLMLIQHLTLRMFFFKIISL